MSAINKFKERLEEIIAEEMMAKKRMAELARERQEIEAAWRTLARYTGEVPQIPTVASNKKTRKPNFSDSVLQLIQGHAPMGINSKGIISYIKERHEVDMKPGNLAVLLQRHKKNGLIRNEGKEWFFNTEAQTKAAA